MAAEQDIFHPARKARGKRILAIRQALRFSRRAFAEQYAHLGLKASTLQSWEDGRFGGLTESGANALCRAFQAEGLRCDPQWLFYGTGQNPLAEKPCIPAASPVSPPQATGTLNHEDKITAELQLFHQHHPGAIDTVVQDNSLSPFLNAGDFVAGKRFFRKEIDQGLERPCIIQTDTGAILVGVLQKAQQAGLYHLKKINAKTEQDIRVFSAAPILWFRRKDQ